MAVVPSWRSPRRSSRAASTASALSTRDPAEQHAALLEAHCARRSTRAPATLSTRTTPGRFGAPRCWSRRSKSGAACSSGQGANDPRAKPAESEQIAGAIEKNRGHVIRARYPEEGHGFARPEHRIGFPGARRKVSGRRFRSVDGRTGSWLHRGGASDRRQLLSVAGRCLIRRQAPPLWIGQSRTKPPVQRDCGQSIRLGTGRRRGGVMPAAWRAAGL